AGIAVHIGAQDGGQPPFHLVVCHRPHDSLAGRRVDEASHPAPGLRDVARGGADSSKGKPMATSLYDLSVPTFLQTVSAVAGFLDDAVRHCDETAADPDVLVLARP